MAEKKKKKDAETELKTKAEAGAAVEEEEKGEAEADAAADEMQTRLAELENELNDAKTATEDAEARLLRMQADFDNFRRRQREDNERIVAQANAAIINGLLPVVDNFERALAAMGDSADRSGVEMIAKQLLAVLANAGVESIEALGAEFDPNLHQAVMQADAGEENKNKITKVLQKGYLLKGKLLRAAMVEVGM